MERLISNGTVSNGMKKLLPVFIIAFVFFGLAKNVDARVAYLLKGSGWASAAGSSGIGWIKFSSSSEGGVSSPINYGVKIEDTGLMSGEAWAGTNYGWLSFNAADLSGPLPADICPSGPCEARVNLSNGDLSGWARFLTPKNNPNGDWEGWVKLRGLSVASSDMPTSRTATILDKISNFFNNLFNIFDTEAATAYGVNINMSTLRLSGVTWGEDVAGWIAFGPPECANCTVRVAATNQVPVVSNVRIEQPLDSWCDPAPFYRVKWDFADGDSIDTQVSAIIKFVKVSDGTVSFTGANTGTGGADTIYRLENPISTLSPNTSYRVDVIATDGKDSSVVASSLATTTPTHYYPLINFTWTPLQIKVSAIETFSNNTTDRSGGSYLPGIPSWAFTQGSIVTSNSQNPVVIFRSFPASAMLTVGDSSGVSCSLQQDFTTGGSGGGSAGSGVKRRIFRER